MNQKALKLDINWSDVCGQFKLNPAEAANPNPDPDPLPALTQPFNSDRQCETKEKLQEKGQMSNI